MKESKTLTKRTYAIRFDFPEGSVYAGDYQGACGFAHQLATAMLFADAEQALSLLQHGYGEGTRQWGKVVTVTA